MELCEHDCDSVLKYSTVKLRHTRSLSMPLPPMQAAPGERWSAFYPYEVPLLDILCKKSYGVGSALQVSFHAQ